MLTIVGLLIGGVITGRELILQAQLRGVLNEVEKYSTAINAFKLKYNALPGDMRNATDYWGTDPAGCPSTFFSAPRTDARTCNGNGNGLLLMSDQMDPMFTWWSPEAYSLWQHLSNAGLIEGTYPGVYQSATVGVSIPKSRREGSGYMMFSTNINSNYAALPQDGTVSSLFIEFSPFRYNQFALTPGEALLLDRKNDDGKPGTGKITATWFWPGPNCLSGRTGYFDPGSIASYNSGFDERACNLYFHLR